MRLLIVDLVVEPARAAVDLAGFLSEAGERVSVVDGGRLELVCVEPFDGVAEAELRFAVGAWALCRRGVRVRVCPRS